MVRTYLHFWILEISHWLFQGPLECDKELITMAQSKTNGGVTGGYQQGNGTERSGLFVLVGDHWNMNFYEFWFSIISWKCHRPNWRNHMFQRGFPQPPTSFGRLFPFSSEITHEVMDFHESIDFNRLQIMQWLGGCGLELWVFIFNQFHHIPYEPLRASCSYKFELATTTALKISSQKDRLSTESVWRMEFSHQT